MQHTPKLHIFVGRDNHFFTLRQSYLHVIYIGRVNPKPIYEVRYSHIKNLSQNYQEAVEKAQEASKQLGLELVVRGSETEQLDEIKRVTAEEAEQRRRLAEAEYAKAEEEAQARRREWWNQWKVSALNDLRGIHTEEVVIELEHQTDAFREKVLNGGGCNWTVDPTDSEKFIVEIKKEPVMPIGAYFGKPLSSVPRSYLQWLVYKSDLCDIDPEETMHKAAFVARWICDNMEVPAERPSEWVGEIKGKMELEVEIDSVRTIDGSYGYVYLYKLVDAEGNQLTWFASSPALKDVSGKFKLKFTVKAHNEYKGIKQTIITRAKVI